MKIVKRTKRRVERSLPAVKRTKYVSEKVIDTVIKVDDSCLDVAK